MDFPRQRQPVKVTFSGHPDDIAFYLTFVRMRVDSYGDNVSQLDATSIKIYPRANND